MPASKPLARKDLTVIELDGETVIYDDTHGDLHYLNATATMVFGLCDGTATARQLAVDIADAYGLPLDEVVSQVEELMRGFRRAKLLQSPAKTPTGSRR